jgi:hypothetical protein
MIINLLQAIMFSKLFINKYFVFFINRLVLYLVHFLDFAIRLIP